MNSTDGSEDDGPVRLRFDRSTVACFDTSPMRALFVCLFFGVILTDATTTRSEPIPGLISTADEGALAGKHGYGCKFCRRGYGCTVRLLARASL